MDRRPIRAKPRSKGNRAELEIITLLKAHGWTGARRNWMSGGQGGGDIIGGPADVHVEVKHRERCAIWSWLAQAEAEARPTDLPLVICRCNRMAWWAFMPADELDALLELAPDQAMNTIRYPGTSRVRLWTWIAAAAAAAIPGAHPSIRFHRPDGPEYAGVPAEFALTLIAARERT